MCWAAKQDNFFNNGRNVFLPSALSFGGFPHYRNRAVSTFTFDTDALAYIAAVVATGATLSQAERLRINQLFLDLKTGPVHGTNLWGMILSMHPLAGTTAAAHAVDGRSPGSFSQTFTGSPTHHNRSITYDGITQHTDTGFAVSAHDPDNFASLVWVVNDTSAGTAHSPFGAYNGIRVMGLERNAISVSRYVYCFNGGNTSGNNAPFTTGFAGVGQDVGTSYLYEAAAATPIVANSDPTFALNNFIAALNSSGVAIQRFAGRLGPDVQCQYLDANAYADLVAAFTTYMT